VITVEAVQEGMGEKRTAEKDVQVAAVDLRLFDELYGAGGSEKVQ